MKLTHILLLALAVSMSLVASFGCSGGEPQSSANDPRVVTPEEAESEGMPQPTAGDSQSGGSMSNDGSDG